MALLSLPQTLSNFLRGQLAGDGGEALVLRSWPPRSTLDLGAVVTWTPTPTASAESIRRTTAAPLLILSPAPPPERATAIRLGADVCLNSDEDPVVVAAHLAALLRPRVEMRVAPGVLRAGNLEIDANSRRVRCNSSELRLSPREFDLLSHLVLNRGQVRRRHDLLSAVWGSRFVGEPKTVDVHIAWLRQKLPAESMVRITTLRGLGYRLDPL